MGQLDFQPSEILRAVKSFAECSQGTQLNRYEVQQEDEGAIEVKVIQARDIEFLKVHTYQKKQFFNKKKIGRYQLALNDILVTSRTDQLLTSVVTEDFVDSVASQNIIVIRLDEHIVDPIFFAGLLRSRIGQHIASTAYKQSGFQRLLTIKEFNEVKFPIPSMEVQKKLACLFGAVSQAACNMHDVINKREALVEDILIEVLGVKQ